MHYISVNLTEIPDRDFVSLKELCQELSISTATGRNWVKLGKITPEYTQNKTPYFTRNYIEILKSEIQSGKNTALKSRRNKKYVSGNSLYNSYVSEGCKNTAILKELLNIIVQKEITLTHDIIQYIVADCALHLFTTKAETTNNRQVNLLQKYLSGKLSLEKYNNLIDALIKNRDTAMNFCRNHPAVFNFEYTYEPGEDILGLIYISCKNIGNRKATGSYYTPTKIVRKLISELNIKSNDKILDPCCGTGNFLLQLPDNILFDDIYGNDIDSTSVKISRLNMALKYPDASIKDICEHITESNFLTDYNGKNFNFIIGNPPWGYNFSHIEKEKLGTLYKTASGNNIESYDVFIERALTSLAKDGHLSFVLPEAVLNVKTHKDIRDIILKTNTIKSIDYLGNVFYGIQCPCIILQLAYTGTPLSTIGITVSYENQIFKINTERNVTSEYFNFTTTDCEYKILNKIKNTDNISFLKGNADFALGIVTGNNKKYISPEKTGDNEIVLKGTDISKYHINPASNYIIFKPESFQQTAPAEMYRAPEKLLYRFICNQLVFAYDDKQTLSLNSCNIVIPKLKDVKIKYILAILNSRIAQFIYKKEFNSVKVLRSHIENIPIPIADKATQDKIISTTELLINGQDIDSAIELYDKLDDMIFELFHLSSYEQQIIKNSVDGENKFLA